ncbi:MAG TPA: RusA family crossover junction endodeoxyribonuclease [Terriglobales bacterium]|nr:RusA family crossover junction endodeoxyribonuclease [Terriglobales bacterium]
MTEPKRMWSCLLPAPISVNAMFVNRKHKDGKSKGRMISPKYVAWRKDAEGSLWLSKPLPSFEGPVNVTLAFQEPSRRQDLDNKAKSVLDLLVRYKIIKDDNNITLRSLTLYWDEKVNGTRVTIWEI